MKTKVLAVVSLVAVLLLVACGRTPAPAPEPQASQTPAEQDHDHDHHHGSAPHGGTLADWGGGAYHVEFTVDHDKQEAMVYILGDDAQTPAPISAETLLLTINEPAFQVELAAQPLEGESAGSASRFVGQHEQLGKVQEFSGTITGEVEGTPYAGEFTEEPHGDDHQH